MNKNRIISLASAYIFFLIAGIGYSVVIKGAGASFPYPIYAKWGLDYAQKTDVQIDYAATGSGKGIKAIREKTVDFGASDAPLTYEELEESGLIQFPMIIGGVVPVFNLRGVKEGQICLTPALLTDIFLGKINAWNDPAIKKLNPDVFLPYLNITVIYREDESGTTWIFTDYLSKVSPEWEKNIGKGKTVQWPVGLGGIKNEGVAKYVQRVDGAIGYVEYTYAVKNKMTSAKLLNREEKWVLPTVESFQAAAANANWKDARGFNLELTNQPGEKSWPITGASFILLHKQQKNAKQAQFMLDFFRWCYQYGQQTALELDYIPIPQNVVDMVEQVWTEQIVYTGKK